MSDFALRVISNDSVASGNEVCTVNAARKYISFNGNGTYTIEAWDLNRLCLVPHQEIDNAFWINYAGAKLGLLALETIGEANRYGYCIKYQWVAMALNSKLEFISLDAAQACVDLMVNGVL